ncbi:MAG: hypothetical protein RJA63_2104 [Pseudomonadota bacterium]|jgi:AraC-like DNA-binding protein
MSQGLHTLGQRFYPGFEMPLAYRPGLEILPAQTEAPRLGLCLLESGRLSLAHAGAVEGPALLLLDETARPACVPSPDVRGASLYFHPEVVNSAFASRILPRAGDADLPLSSAQDLYLFEAFLGLNGQVALVPLNPVSAARLGRCFREIGALIETQPHEVWPCMTRSFLIEALFLLRLVLQEAHAAAQPAVRDPRLERALALLHEHFHEPLSLDEVARHSATNRTTLNALLRQRTGLPMRAYLVELRMRMAESLLRDTELPVNVIAHRVGYENPSHFIRQFRSQRGVTPNSFRQTRH